MSNTQSLYIDTALDFEKVSMDARLSDNSDTWPQEVMQELMKQHPYLGQYDVVPEMTQVEGDKGYGFGYFTISNKTSLPPTPGGEALAAGAGVTTIRVPIIIKDQKVSSFDVFIGPRPYPLTEERVRQAMFRPQLFDAAKTAPDSMSLVDKLYPPGRTNSGMVSDGALSSPAVKISSAKPRFLMEAIGSTISRSDLDTLASNLRGNMKVAMALRHNDATLPFMQFLAGLQPLETRQIAKFASESIQPNVVMVTRQGDGYHIKMAASDTYSPEETVTDRATMEDIAGPDMVQQADKSGVAIVSTDPVVRDIAEDEKAEKVTRFGEYKVKASDGKELMGWVFPTVLDFDGAQLPMSLFSNGSTAAMQDEIVGSFVGAGTNVIRGKMEGNGFFYRVTASGSVLAFVPGKILHPFADENGEGVIFDSVMGEPCRVRLVTGMKAIAKIGEGEYAIPGDVHWLPFDDSALVKLMDSPEAFAKISHVKKASQIVTIKSDGYTWTFSGGCGLHKLAHQDTFGLDAANAMFMSCILGMDEPTAMRALAISGQRGQVKVAGCRNIVLVHEKLASARAESHKMWEQIPKRYNLLKEAASLEDATTVDKVLSIGFLNPENIGLFVSYLPDIDRTISKLAEILVAVRLGLKDIPEIAVKNSMERLDEVATALKALMYRAAEA